MISRHPSINPQLWGSLQSLRDFLDTADQGVGGYRITEPKAGIVRVDLRWAWWLWLRTSRRQRAVALENLRNVLRSWVMPGGVYLDLRGGILPLWCRR